MCQCHLDSELLQELAHKHYLEEEASLSKSYRIAILGATVLLVKSC